MIRFLLWTTVASVLSSIFWPPNIWRAVLLGLATAWAVLWTERIWARAKAAAHSRAFVFMVCGTVTGLAGGIVILALNLLLAWFGYHGFSVLEMNFGNELNWGQPTLARCLEPPVVTTLCVLGIGWCHLNRNRARAWFLMLLTLVGASLKRASVLGNSDPGSALFLFFLGALPFALLWLGGARIANKQLPPRAPADGQQN